MCHSFGRKVIGSEVCNLTSCSTRPAGRSDARPGNDSPQQKIADMFVENFNDPILLTDAFHDKERARGVLRETFGSTRTPLLRAAMGIARGQLRQRLGRPAGHPGT